MIGVQLSMPPILVHMPAFEVVTHVLQSYTDIKSLGHCGNGVGFSSCMKLCPLGLLCRLCAF